MAQVRVGDVGAVIAGALERLQTTHMLDGPFTRDQATLVLAALQAKRRLTYLFRLDNDYEYVCRDPSGLEGRHHCHRQAAQPYMYVENHGNRGAELHIGTESDKGTDYMVRRLVTAHHYKDFAVHFPAGASIEFVKLQLELVFPRVSVEPYIEQPHMYMLRVGGSSVSMFWYNSKTSTLWKPCA